MKDFKKMSSLIDPQDLSKLQKFQGVIASVSGGVDSTVMLYNLYLLAKTQKNMNLSVIHFNYGLRGKESDADEKLVLGICAELGVPCETIQVQSQSQPPAKISIQNWAREFRMEYFYRKISAGYVIATGHHCDDVVETAIFRLARGTYPENLNGFRGLEHGFYRPLLQLKKKNIEEFAKVHGIPSRHDSSNDSLFYTRNRIRHVVVKELRNVNSSLTETVGHLCDDSRLYYQLALQADLADVASNMSSSKIPSALIRLILIQNTSKAFHHETSPDEILNCQTHILPAMSRSFFDDLATILTNKLEAFVRGKDRLKKGWIHDLPNGSIILRPLKILEPIKNKKIENEKKRDNKERENKERENKEQPNKDSRCLGLDSAEKSSLKKDFWQNLYYSPKKRPNLNLHHLAQNETAEDLWSLAKVESIHLQKGSKIRIPLLTGHEAGCSLEFEYKVSANDSELSQGHTQRATQVHMEIVAGWLALLESEKAAFETEGFHEILTNLGLQMELAYCVLMNGRVSCVVWENMVVPCETGKPAKVYFTGEICISFHQSNLGKEA